MPTIREYLEVDAKGSLVASSRDRMWGGITVDEISLAPNIEATTPAQEHLIIGMVVAGVTYCYQRRNKKEYHGLVGPGSAMIIPAGDAAYFRSDTAHLSSATSIPLELLADAAQAMGYSGKQYADVTSAFDLRDVLITDIISIFIDELQKPAHPAQALIVGAAGKALAAHLVRLCNPRVAPRDPPVLGRRQLALVQNAVHDARPSEQIELDDLANVAQINSFAFVRAFKDSTGESPMACLERLQMHRAKRLIKSGLVPLTEIAAAAGFADRQFFARRFLACTGLTPQQYQRECKR